jgi:molecular chaperone GrpE
VAPQHDDDGEPQVRVVDRRWWARGQNAGADDGPASLKPTYVEDLEQRLGDTTRQLQAALADRRQAVEEFEQVKGRLRRDTAREVERGRRAVVVELLDVMDNLERALQAARDAGAKGDATGLMRGVELVRD